MAVAFIVHLFTHIAAVTIDPADASVRAKQSYSSPMPLFDRTKQLHVIQELRCYLCDVRVYVSKAIQTNVILLSIGCHLAIMKRRLYDMCDINIMNLNLVALK